VRALEFLRRLEERKLVKWSQTISRVREEVERAESAIRSLGARRS
jgi:flagellar biosynthesis chaperone FliJ